MIKLRPDSKSTLNVGEDVYIFENLKNSLKISVCYTGK